MRRLRDLAEADYNESEIQMTVGQSRSEDSNYSCHNSLCSRRVRFVVILVVAELVCCCRYYVISQGGKRSRKIRQGGHQSHVRFIHLELFLCRDNSHSEWILIGYQVHCNSAVLDHSRIATRPCLTPATTIAESVEQGPLYVDAKSWGQP
jgi:hypothetical protein